VSGAVDRQTDCPDTGCGPSLDPLLNKQKNIKDLSDPVDGFEIGDNREKLQELGEGKRIVVVANALAVRKGGGESCNCKLTTVADADNHIVLVARVLRSRRGETLKELLSRREKASITAEFAPGRVWICHISRERISNP
jgi:hypothetical protein